MYKPDVDGIHKLIPATTAPTATVAVVGDSHEAGGAHRRSEAGGRGR